MPTTIRRSETITVSEKRRGILHAVGWQVTQSLWSPPTDLYETDSAFIVRVELAGMRESDFEVIFDQGYLFVRGARPEVSTERRAYHQMEIRFGKFATTIAVPGPVDLDQSEAQYKDGFMTVVLAKERPKQFKIEE